MIRFLILVLNVFMIICFKTMITNARKIVEYITVVKDKTKPRNHSTRFFVRCLFGLI